SRPREPRGATACVWGLAGPLSSLRRRGMRGELDVDLAEARLEGELNRDAVFVVADPEVAGERARLLDGDLGLDEQAGERAVGGVAAEELAVDVDAVGFVGAAG